MTDTTQARIPLGSSDLRVFPLNLGGNVFGWTADEQQSFALLDAYSAAGGNFVDTADVYSAWVPGNPGGVSEQIIGRWVAARKNRDEIVLATKIGAREDAKGLSAANVRKATEASLQRLQTEHIDLLYTHYDDPTVPVAEFLGALTELVGEGKVRHIAASNIDAERLTEALQVSERDGLARYVAIQPHYNLVSRDTYEGPLAAAAEQGGLGALPYYSLASGFLTGKYRPGSTVESARAAGAGVYLDSPRGLAVLAALDAVAEARGVSVTAVALAWLRAQPTVVAPVVSARTTEQLEVLLSSTEVTLDDAEVAALTSASS
ncbi:aldo/keto reductase [Actinoalloteichus hymeniacidonis]|uniref:Oxidoreductase, aryl-alcohol dehydrogenase like protein n=1 Tax=Actinoalloteichus hymeniacidonis TaxID=340345 RepID=A0AAC9MZW5_9PSEU|nr:aldo/keto reductase [Actinoalloteichus hymeniacidonis]AOS64785.1 putative oxidoreductase, aryl-alcohol dehydrogenase like protein [Actinoalloteichus hymeniacidonis]MBB5907140.1 aryl-alcohol dehydrogenase-like predicted oxidoreductase [Actinoalloteichus hymeniacidonis]